MGWTHQRTGSGRRTLTALLLLAVWGNAAPAAPEPDPLQQLRTVLENTTPDLQARQRDTRDCIDALFSLVDLYNAALLPGWRDQHPDPEVAEVDRLNRHQVMDRFTEGVRNALHRRDPLAVAAMADLIARLARTGCTAGTGGPPGLLRQFAPDLAQLALLGSPEVRIAAARALGRIEADADTAALALEKALETTDLELRRTAATALADLLQAMVREDAGFQHADERVAAVRSVTRLLFALQQTLTDRDTQVRRQGIASIGLAAVTVCRLLSDPAGPECVDTPLSAAAVLAERRALRPLLLALRGQVDALAEAISDPDEVVCLKAQQTLEEIARVHGRCQKQVQAFLPPLNLEDPLRQELEAVVPRLAARLAEGEVRVRRSAVGVLEVLGPLARGVIPTLVASLNDPDACVRWSAVRTLDRLGSEGLRPALPALSRLLRDRDTDVREAVAVALSHLDKSMDPVRMVQVHYGSPPTPSDLPVPALLQSSQSGPVALRVASLRLLGQCGEEARSALPILCRALTDTDAQVRRTAAEALGTLGPLARDAVTDLRRALDDPIEDVRVAVDRALLRIVRISQ